jgi:hypothetical protein
VSDLDEIWEQLDAETTSAPGDVRRRLPSSSEFDLFLTQSRPSRQLGFFAAFDEKPGTLWRQLAGSHGMRVSVDPRAARPSVHLVERESGFHSIFESLVRDLIKGLQSLGALSPASRPLAMDFVAGRIARWQACLKADAEGLSGEKRAGLVGELTLLRLLVDGGIDPQQAVSGWTGPAQALQDFQFPGGAFEVKASRQTRPTAVRISSERQLDTSNIERLVLLHVSLDERSGGDGVSLPDLVDEVRAAVGRDSDAGLLLDDRLLEYGYMDLHAPRYEGSSYAVRSLEWFDVGDGFPRVVEADLPAGVGDVHYALSLAACEGFRLSEDEVARLMEEFSA